MRKGLVVQRRHVYSRAIVLFLVLLGLTSPLWAESLEQGRAIQVQVPYEAPPKRQDLSAESVPQNTKALTPQETQRAEALLPLLEGAQEFWAMGEFVHLGEPSVPVLVKGLAMPGPRIRYNVIETVSMLKAASAVPALVGTAKELNEIPRVREHALRVAVRLDAAKAVDAIEAMAKDQNSSIRKAAAFEARYVREKAVVPVLIGMIVDEERFVALSAVQSLWILSRHETEFHDWETSTKQDRQEWATEWSEWWNSQKDSFEMMDPKRPARAR
ncbi:MAG: HEAT repeat domain-containing protein [Nitrospira sp.]|nr:HEAT repeat domain-containing protein [Nitrospira sp.]TKB72103.1 MAG: HEAT repeat domain-containing protein [Nitrospira sp.]